MKEEFKELYDYIIQSEDEDKMRVLGKVTKDMMCKLIDSNSQQAREYLDMLQSVKWCNYVTAKEADKVISEMSPKPIWGRSSWNNMMSEMEYPMCEEPYYNDSALYLTMCMISSDSGETLRRIMQSRGIAVDDDSMFEAIHLLALDKLKDKDGVFDIRLYFGL